MESSRVELSLRSGRRWFGGEVVVAARQEETGGDELMVLLFNEWVNEGINGFIQVPGSKLVLRGE